MNKKDEYRRIYTSSFSDTQEWTSWFINSVCSDDDIILGYGPEGTPESGMVALPYRFTPFSSGTGDPMQAVYIAGVATLPKARGKGSMSTLMCDALRLARMRGVDVCALIPANRRLFFFYERFGFSTVFYATEERYTSVHDFIPPVDTVYPQPDYGIFHRLEEKRPYTMCHSERDFENILTDTRLSRGHVVTAVCGDGCAMAFASPMSDGTVFVNALLSDSGEAAEAALSRLKEITGETSFLVMRDPDSGTKATLRARGMIRLLNVGRVLSSLAACSPGTSATIRVRDHLLPENNGVYILSDGNCKKEETGVRHGKVTLDVTVDVLARILFNTPRLGDVFNLPATRPAMYLMLD